MTWLLIALLGPLLWSVCNQIDRYFLSRYFAHETLGALLMFSSLIGIVALPVAWAFSDPFCGYSARQIGLLLGAGLAGVYGIYLYLLALRDEEASLVVPFWQLIPVFGYLFGWLVLGETLAPRQIGASLAIIAGAMALSVDPATLGRGLRIKWRLAGLMTASSVIFGLHAVVFKFVAEKADFWGACFWEYAGFVVAGVWLWIFSPASRRSFLHILTPSKRRDFGWIMGLCVFSEVITLVGNLATNLALLMAPVAMVLLVSSMQPVFVFLLGLASTVFFPRFVTESLSRRTVVHKVCCLLVICAAGAWLM
jgi:drug/metabolite transporter (DMT)-like permease